MNKYFIVINGISKVPYIYILNTAVEIFSLYEYLDQIHEIKDVVILL